MTLDFRTAQRQYEENVRFLGSNGGKTDPEKFNLYAGVSNLAEGLAVLSSEVDSLRSDMQALKRK